MAELPPHVLTLLDDRDPATFILGHTRQEVVGEFYRKENVDAAARWLSSNTSQGVRSGVTHYAWLVREPTNAMDSDAVAVFVGRYHVGYLPREAAPYWSEVLAVLEHRYSRRVACVARITEEDDEPGMWNVWLMLHTSKNPPRRR